MGWDTNTKVDNLISEDPNYRSDLSLIAFENSYFSQLEYFNWFMVNITIKGDKDYRNYTYHPYIFGPDTAT